MASEVRWHLHAYFFWTDGVGIDVPNTNMFVFSARRPRVDCRHAASSMVAARLAAYHGLWYVSVFKLGTVAAETNFHAWRDYTPLVTWVDGLWSSKKLSHAQYLSLARNFGTGYAARKRDVLEVTRDEMVQSITEHIILEKAGLQRLPCHTYPEIERFVDTFTGAAMWRRPMLVIVAATNMGRACLPNTLWNALPASWAFLDSSRSLWRGTTPWTSLTMTTDFTVASSWTVSLTLFFSRPTGRRCKAGLRRPRAGGRKQ